MMTDPISDMLTRIRNASAVKKAEAVMPYSNVKLAIAKILVAEGYLSGVDVREEGHRVLALTLKYQGRTPAVTAIRRVSTPGQRMYRKATELPDVRSGYGLAILSTSSGIMTHKEARSRKLGGEVLCEVF